MLGETCNDLSAFATLRKVHECEEVTDLPVNVAAYCGCRDSFPANLCQLCPEGTVVYDDDEYTPPGSGAANCRELADFATYVENSLMCSEVQEYAYDCCVQEQNPNNGTVPTLAPGDPSGGSFHRGVFSVLTFVGIFAASFVTFSS